MSWYWPLIEKNLIPDFALRAGIRGLLKKRIKEITAPTEERQQEALKELMQKLQTGPIAVNTDDANEQHYELPTPFFQYSLGKNLKYSGCYYTNGNETLDQAEDAMLELYAQRAQLASGQDILELGCGWGSLSLFMAKKFPGSNITVISNSKTQKEFIDGEAQKRGISNLTVITSNINDFDIEKQFDRIVSIEMFEHMRNYKLLFANVAKWLKDDGLCFIHVFTHRSIPYLFEIKDESDWMSKYFFTGGIMPSNDLYHCFNESIQVVDQWLVDGTHYEKTANHWLDNMDKHRKEIMPLFEQTYGKSDALKWWVYWRIFYMACAELWGFDNGREWMISHYLFKKTPVA